MKRSLLLVLVILVVSPAAAQSADELFQQAWRAERVASNPEAAIALYRQVVDLPGAERELVARAWLQMGKAYEVLGQDRAVGAYSRVVRDFADFAEVAREAEARIAGLTVPNPAGAQVRKKPMSQTILDGALAAEIGTWGSSLSPSGRFMAGRASDTLGVLIVDLQSGSRRLYSVEGEWRGGRVAGRDWIDYVRFSPDEENISFVVTRDGGSAADLVIMDTDTGSSELLIEFGDYYRDVRGVEPDNLSAQVHDWSQDGKTLLVFSPWWTHNDNGDGEYYEELLAVPVEGGGPNFIGVLPPEEGSNWEQSCLSADGRYAFTDVTMDDGGRGWRVRRFDLQTGKTAIWRRGWLWGCTWEKNRVLVADYDLSGVVLKAASPSGTSALDDTVVARLDRDVWSYSGSKVADIPIFSGTRNSLVVAQVTDWAVEHPGLSRESVVTLDDGFRLDTSAWSRSGRQYAWTTRPTSETLKIWDSDNGARSEYELDKRPMVLRWLDESTLTYFERPDSVGANVDPLDIVVLDLSSGRETRVTWNQVEALGLRRLIPVDGNRWLGRRADDPHCYVVTSPADWTVQTLGCSERAGRPTDIKPSPYQSRAVLSRAMPDTTHQIDILDLETGSVERLTALDALPKAYKNVQWVGPDELMIGVWSPPGEPNWANRPVLESTYLLNLTTDELVPVLGGIFDQFQPISVGAAPGGRQVAVFGRARSTVSEDALTILHNVLGDL